MSWHPHIFVSKKYHVNKKGRTDNEYYTYDEVQICILKMNRISGQRDGDGKRSACLQLTNFGQLNGNISAMCEISRNTIRLVNSNENIAQNTINRSRPINGRKKRPTCTVPAENSHKMHAAEDI